MYGEQVSWKCTTLASRSFPTKINESLTNSGRVFYFSFALKEIRIENPVLGREPWLNALRILHPCVRQETPKPIRLLRPIVSELPSKTFPALCILLFLNYLHINRPFSLLKTNTLCTSLLCFLLCTKCLIHSMLPHCLRNFHTYVNFPYAGIKLIFSC